MAYWKFDLTFENLGALPEGTVGFLVRTMTSIGNEALSFGMLSGSESVTVSINTAYPGGNAIGDFPTFELSESDQVWFTAILINNADTATDLYSIGPYTVGEVGTEVPAP